MAESKEKKKKEITQTSGKQAVILLGGKQYIVAENDELNVEKIDKKEKSTFAYQIYSRIRALWYTQVSSRL